MSKNTNLSFLTDFITADIVNSRVGINNASPQTTFDVTGTGKFSGILTLGSTISNGTYAYTLPSATGTLALTSDIPSVSGYVPYTGATQAVNLGYNSLSASFLRIDGAGPTLGSYLGFKHSTNVTTGADGYTSIYTFGTNTIAFKSVSGATTRDFSFSMASITPGVPGGRTYTLPDADGTIALTSNIPANPVGGTGTSGTIPVFTGSTTIGNSIIQSNATQVNVVGNGSQLLFDSLGQSKSGGIQYTNDFELLINNSRGVGSAIYLGNVNMDFHTNVSGNPRLRITSGGNILVGTTTDNGAKLQVSGTSRFSGNVGIGVAPSYPLHISSNIQDFTAAIINTNASDNAGLLIKAGVNTGNSVLRVQKGNGSDLFLVDASGNVGIGTASPNIYNLTNTRNLTLVNDGGYGVIAAVGSSGNGGEIDFGNSSIRHAAIASLDGSNLAFYTNGNNSGITATERMRITSGGDVGIGTASPVARLHAENPSSGDPTSLSSVPTTNVFGFSTSPGGMLAGGISASGGTHVWLQGRNTGAAGVAYSIGINPLGGNVGIGNVPIDGFTGYRLQVGSLSDDQTFISIGCASTGLGPANGLVLGNDLLGAWIIQRENLPLRFSTNNTEQMRITSAGDVCIGITSALQPAANRGSLSINGVSSSILSFGVGSATKAYLYTGGTTLTVESVGASADIVFAAGNADRLKITSSGNVLIGTTTDSGYKLRVNGMSYLDGYNYASSIQYTRAVSNTVNPAGGEGVLIFSGGQAAMRMNSNYTMNFDMYNSGNQFTALQIRQTGNTVQVNSPDNSLCLALAFGGTEHGYLGATSGFGRSLLAYSVNGGYVYLSSSSTWVSASDRNRKKNFENYNKGLSEICNLKPTLFNLKTQSDDEPKIAGLIAQEVGEHIQEAFSDGEFIGIDYNVLTVTIINAIKELKQQIDTLTNENN